MSQERERILHLNSLLTRSSSYPLCCPWFWGCAGNVWKLTGHDCYPPLQTTAHTYKLSDRVAGCADFLVGVTVMPFSTVRSVESCWYFGDSYCKLRTCFDTSFCFASLFHLCCISGDRYIAVTDPLSYPTKFTVSVSGMCIVLSCFFCVTYSFSVFYTGANEEGIEELVVSLTCVRGCQAPLNQNWVLLCFLLFFIPTVAMVFIYSKTFLVAKHQARKIESTTRQAQSSSESYKERVAKRERKAARTLGIAMAAFLVSWLPYVTDAVIDVYMNFITPPYVYEILVWCVYYNSTMNFLIYAFFYPWFRKAIKLIVSGKVLRSDSSTNNLFSWRQIKNITVETSKLT